MLRNSDLAVQKVGYVQKIVYAYERFLFTVVKFRVIVEYAENGAFKRGLRQMPVADCDMNPSYFATLLLWAWTIRSESGF